MQIESFSALPLADVVKAYLYQQYFDDSDLQGFIEASNATFQGYLNWFRETPLSVYTNPSISGPLLDWVGTGIYDISRPVVSNGSTRYVAAYGSLPYAKNPYLKHVKISNETASIVDDDIYKRVLTWHSYLGDGRNTSIYWLRRRVARFIYGFSGTDVSADYFSKISIIRPPLSFSAAYTTGPYATQPYSTRKSRRTLAAHALQITVPATSVSVAFQNLLEQGYLALPFQTRFSVLISS